MPRSERVPGVVLPLDLSFAPLPRALLFTHEKQRGKWLWR